jgi:adenine-specific DNA-methyltransferase
MPPRGDAQWLLILGFAFESDVENSVQNQKAGAFRVDKVRMNDDLLQAGLTKKDKKAATFVTIGEPDIGVARRRFGDRRDSRPGHLRPDQGRGESPLGGRHRLLDGRRRLRRRQLHGAPGVFLRWRQGRFCQVETRLVRFGQGQDEKKVENTLKIELDDEAFDRLYGFVSHPIEFRAGKRVAVRVVSQFGEESTKVIGLGR